jgi:spore coat polysaccharide biosynthesis protein SpsF (cytidylyltransferase family)
MSRGPTVITIIQARMGSSRLPGKTLEQVGGKSLIKNVIERAIAIKSSEHTVVATTIDRSDDVLVSELQNYSSIFVRRGSSVDVRSRFLHIAREFEADYIVRLTADDPFKDPSLVDDGVEAAISGSYDYLCNFVPYTLPIGMDFEVFKAGALFTSENRSSSSSDLEHVTPFLRESPDFHRKFVVYEPFFPNIRLTVDFADDLNYCDQLGRVINSMNNCDFSWSNTKSAILNLSNLEK